MILQKEQSHRQDILSQTVRSLTNAQLWAATLQMDYEYA